MSTRFQRLIPAPLLSAVLFLLWPLLNQSWSFGQLLLGALLSVVIPWLMWPTQAQGSGPRRPLVALRLFFTVLKDIITSNIDVAKLILGRESKIRPGFVWFPLTLTDPQGIVVLAGIITMTPGTLSADVSDDRRHLLIHALNVDDELALIDAIKSRYERPLLEIFQ